MVNKGRREGRNKKRNERTSKGGRKKARTWKGMFMKYTGN